MRATQRLIARGFEAYLVGGCVRDLLLGRTPKDYDIATEARPQQVKRTFPRNCRIIGRRFKLAHLHFDNNTKILEVSTFRRPPEEEGDEEDLLITRDNEFGTSEEDAMRRDFTVNALFLDPSRDCILDFTDGLADVRDKVIRTIGDPVVRFREDPVRILRAVKFAGRLGFSIEPKTFAAMAETAGDLARAAPPRVLEEILRLLRGGHALDSFQLLRDVGALRTLVPVVAEFLATAAHDERVAFWRLLEALDHQVLHGHVPGNAVLLAALFVEPVLHMAKARPGRSASSIAEQLLGNLGIDLRLPRRDAGCLKRICGVQHRFTAAEGEQKFRVAGFVNGPYFDEAFELFELRATASGDDELIAQWRELAGDTPVRRHGDDEGTADDEATEESLATGELAGPADGDERRGRRRRRRGRRRGRHRDDEENLEAGCDDEGAEPDAAATADDAPRDDDGTGADEPFAAAGDDAGGEVAEPEPRMGDEPGRRRRRRRRRGRGRGDTFPRSEDPAPHGDAVDPDTHQGHVARAHEDVDPDAPFERDADAPQQGDEHDDELGTEADDPATTEGGTPAEGDRDGSRRRRRRRRRRGRREGGEGVDQPDESGQPREAQQRQAGQQRQAEQQRPAAQRPQPRQDDNRQDRRSRRDKRRERDRGRGLPRDVDVVPRYRDRRGKVEVIEPAPLDLSAFDVELDPKRVPTFGSIVEGKSRPKHRSPRVPEDGNDKYRPPPPPGGSSGPGAPPPPPPADDDGDTFGDW